MATSTTYLERTFAAGNRRKWTWSAWVKRANLGSNNWLFHTYVATSNECSIFFTPDDQFAFSIYTGNNNNGRLTTNRKFRDTSAWYHLQCVWDSGNSTAGNRMRMYVNGVEETSFATDINPSLDYEPIFNSGINHTIGQYGNNDAGMRFSGSISHMHFSDGYAYDASTFGETDSTTGEWKIKTNPTFTLGTNGFTILKDGNTITDQSSNSNNWSASGTLTKTEDNPSNVFATLNPLHMDDPASQYFLSLGNLRQNVTNNDGHRETGFTLHPKGLKGYFEVKCTVDPNFHLGLQNVTSRLLNTNYYSLSSPNYYYMQASNPVKISYANGGSSATHIASYFSQISVGDIIGCAFDFTGTNKNVWFHKNGTYGNNGSGVGNPATGAYPAMTSTQLTADEYEFIVSPNTGSGNGQLDFNFGNGYFGTTAVSSAGTNASGNGIFEYDVPTGYTALSTKGLNL